MEFYIHPIYRCCLYCIVLLRILEQYGYTPIYGIHSKWILSIIIEKTHACNMIFRLSLLREGSVSAQPDNSFLIDCRFSVLTPAQSTDSSGLQQRNVQHIIVWLQIIQRESDAELDLIREQLFELLEASAGDVGLRLSYSGLKKASGIGSMASALSRYFATFSSPLASRNSVKVMGSICMKFTLPAGKEEGFARAIPSRETAQAI